MVVTANMTGLSLKPPSTGLPEIPPFHDPVSPALESMGGGGGGGRPLLWALLIDINLPSLSQVNIECVNKTITSFAAGVYVMEAAIEQLCGSVVVCGVW